MSQTTIKIEFTETTKQVHANVKMEVTSEVVKGEDLLEETKKLFEQAQEFAKQKTISKMR